MKKLLLLLSISCLFINNNFAQGIDFRIQPDGSFLSKQDSKNYIVLNYPNETKNELYTRILTAVTRLYNSPTDVINKVDGEIISVNGSKRNCISIKALGLTLLRSIDYNLKFQFKDGRIKIDAPIVGCFNEPEDPITPVGEWNDINGVFKKGVANPKKQKTIDDFNDNINDIILDILDEADASKNNDW